MPLAVSAGVCTAGRTGTVVTGFGFAGAGACACAAVASRIMTVADSIDLMTCPKGGQGGADD